MVADDLPVLRCGIATADPGAVAIRRVAVSAEGRRDPGQTVAAAITALTPGTAILLEHAGPAASRWSLERAVAFAADVTDPLSGRRARALAPAEVDDLIAAFAAAADRVRRLGGRPMIAAVDDDLLHGALSPLGGGGPDGEARMLALLAACAPCDLMLTVEDLAPGGLTPAAGVAFARRGIAVSGADRIVVVGGTSWLEPLRTRHKGRRVDTRGVGLASAAWCATALSVPVWGCVRGDVDDDRLRRTARRLGLAGVVRLDDVQPGRP